MKRLLVGAALLGAIVAQSAAAQGGAVTITGDVQSTIVVPDISGAVGSGRLNPAYFAGFGTGYDGVANLWFRNSAGTVLSACTGSLLKGGFNILTAAHCVSNGTILTSASFTARFKNSIGGWTDINGSVYKVKAGYDGAVINNNDVAVLRLDREADPWMTQYDVLSGNPFAREVYFNGYGRTGTGATGDSFGNNQFNDLAIRRTGSNLFDASCFGDLSGAYCYNSLAPSALRYGAGGSLLYDFDPAGGSISSFSCATLGYCEAGYGLREVAVGRGDSGGAAFTTGFEIAGVASWGSGSTSLGAFNSIGGHACVAKYTGNEYCMSNYEFVSGATVPEPATLSLFGTGLFAIALGLRRRNSK